MIIIKHRANTIAELNRTPCEYGVEIDIRSHNNQLILHHDPLQPGELFEDWLTHYHHRFIILNIKEEGLELYILDLMKKYNISSFFFLDQSFPALIKTTTSGEKRTAVRISEYEDIKTALNLTGKSEWVWVDLFTCFPLNSHRYNALRNAGYKLCLVSPELLGRECSQELINLQQHIISHNMFFHAVCTKKPNLWKQLNFIKNHISD